MTTNKELEVTKELRDIMSNWFVHFFDNNDNTKEWGYFEQDLAELLKNQDIQSRRDELNRVAGSDAYAKGSKESVRFVSNHINERLKALEE